jgi:hypothetical protein
VSSWLSTGTNGTPNMNRLRISRSRVTRYKSDAGEVLRYAS